MKHLFYLLLIGMSISVYGCETSNTTYEEPVIPEVPTTPDEEGSEGENPNGNNNNHESLQIKFTIGNNTATATLHDNATARDFISQLPMTVNMTDYGLTEKIFYLPNNYRLSTEGAPSGYDPSIGDITLYAPWNNIAIFYRDYGYSNGLVPIGKIDNGGINLFQVSGGLTAIIERL